MADKLLSYALKSLARHISVNVAGLSGSFVVGPDFDWDNKPNPLNPGGGIIRRDLPFVGSVLVTSKEGPFSVGNILYDHEIVIHSELCASDFTQLVDMTSDLRQSIRNSTNPQTSNIGIVLYDFSVVSGSYYANAGTLQVEIGKTEFFGPEDMNTQGNRKYVSVTPISLSSFKDNTATLLENMGRVDITDS